MSEQQPHSPNLDDARLDRVDSVTTLVEDRHEIEGTSQGTWNDDSPQPLSPAYASVHHPLSEIQGLVPGTWDDIYPYRDLHEPPPLAPDGGPILALYLQYVQNQRTPRSFDFGTDFGGVENISIPSASSEAPAPRIFAVEEFRASPPSPIPQFQFEATLIPARRIVGPRTEVWEGPYEYADENEDADENEEGDDAARSHDEGEIRQDSGERRTPRVAEHAQ